jgi:hypothetical protein
MHDHRCHERAQRAGDLLAAVDRGACQDIGEIKVRTALRDVLGDAELKRELLALAVARGEDPANGSGMDL